jgi:CHRD domain/Glucose / Sorbosone dehydrogenase/Calx-beta domain
VFNWTAPPTDVGPVTFYAAGNQANNDGNTSGDNVYRTFVASAPASSTPDFAITTTPSSRIVVPGGSDDGSTPSDNPFFSINSGLSGEAAANVKKIFGYGFRNGFGMAVDPLTGNLWIEENGDDAFDELNRVRPGFNGGWIQAMGPVSRIDQFKSIESTYGNGNLQQLRWPPSNIAGTPQAALANLYSLSGSQYTDPEFSWKYAVAPSPIGFVKGTGLGKQFEGDMLVGASRTTLSNGFLFRFKFNADRQHFVFTDSRLADLVADNSDKFDLAESETLLIGRDFGVTTDIQTGPSGSVYVVSLSNGAVYEIKSKPPEVFVASLNGAQGVPPTNSPATGTAVLVLSLDETTARLSLNFAGLTSIQTDAHIHGPAMPGVTAGVLFPLPTGQISDFEIKLSAIQVQDLKNGLLYVNVHTSNFPTGEIRGQFGASPTASSLQLDATRYSVGEGEGSVVIGVTRLGNLNNAASIVYSASDTSFVTPCNVNNGSASSRCDYSTVLNTLSFAPGESFKTFAIPIIDDAYDESDETFSITLRTPEGGFLGPTFNASITIVDNDLITGTNPIFSTPFLVRQHYLDFLSREPEVTEPWTAVLNNCSDINNNPACDRLTVSAAFLGSPEFQLKGFFVYHFYKLSFNRLPEYTEIVGDMSSVTGQTPQDVFLRKAAFTNSFVQRIEFVNTFAGLTNAQYVSTLMNRYSLTQVTTPNPSQPDGPNKITLTSSDLLNQLNGGTLTRAQVLRAMADSDEVLNREYVQGFVAMQYYGYLRRTPEVAGYNAWVNNLNANPTDFRTMVNGFMNSIEYRMRFGPQ